MDKKLTVADMAKYLSISKEAIYNRLRRNTLESVTQDGKKYVLLTPNVEKEAKLPKKRGAANSVNNEYVSLLKNQVEELKEKNEKLESVRDRLYYEKENILIESQNKIEKIYKERDEQLKNILVLTNMPTLEHKYQEKPIEVAENIKEDIVEQICKTFIEWELLKDRLQKIGFADIHRKKITKKIEQKIGENQHVKISNDKIYIDKDVKLKQIIGKK
ncbi:MAG: integrase [Sulfurospirillum sp.]|nr:integrase [Sulfurospirillum sp.]MBL0703090.1 integrase [Sulfurospirillum sp.]